MKLLTKILIALVVFFAIGFGYSYNQWQKDKDRANRMTVNYKDAIKQNNELNLTLKELNSEQEKRVKVLTDSLKIKPKKVKEYINTVIHDTIRDTIMIKLTLVEPFTYKFTQDTGCFHLAGLVNNKNEIPVLQFTELDYDNTIEALIYQDRQQWQFLFIKSKFLGKKYNELATFSKCGVSTVQKINIIKK